MFGALTKFFDLREGETRPAVQAFFTLFGLIAGHTILETARDALFLSKLPADRLTLVYVLVAFVTLVVADLNTRFVRRFGKRNALVVTLLVAAYGTTLLHSMHLAEPQLFALYAWSALVGTLIGVQFWMFAGTIFTVAQGKRLFAPIGGGGVLGAVAGAGFAAGMVQFIPVKRLLLVSASLFVITALFLTTVKSDEVEPPKVQPASDPDPEDGPRRESIIELFRRQPYLLTLGAFIALSTAAVLVVDYLFKTVASQTVARPLLGAFFAKSYAVFNALSLLVQFFVAGRMLRRLGVVPALVLLPLLLLGGSGMMVFAGASLAFALITKGADGAFRYSLQRVGTELLWMPLMGETRDRGKTLLDSVFARAVQAATAAILLALAAVHRDSPRVLAAIIVGLTIGWLALIVRLRSQYLDLFRQALSRGTLDASEFTEELDLTSLEQVMEALSSRESRRVLAAIELLTEKKRSRLIPGLILYHESDEVVVRALSVITTPDRRDWPPLAERLLLRGSEQVRVAALRALAKAGDSRAMVRALQDDSPAVRAHAAYQIARDDDRDPLRVGAVRELLDLEGEQRIAAIRGLLQAMRDTPDPRFARLPLALARLDHDPGLVVQVAATMAVLPHPRNVAYLVAHLKSRQSRDGVREALVAHGAPALDALIEILHDPEVDPRLLLHIPRSIAPFMTQRAADVLAEQLANSKSGQIRYKCLRGLGALAAERKIHFDAAAMEVEVKKNLVEYLRFVSLTAPLAAEKSEGVVASTGKLVLGLLEDKAKQALERAFRLLQLIHREDMRSVHIAVVSNDKRLRAQALEFLDTLTAGRGKSLADQNEMRELLRLAADDLKTTERIARSSKFIPEAPQSADAAILALLEDSDDGLATLAGYHALALGRPELTAAVAKACVARPGLTIASTIELPATSMDLPRRRPEERTHA